MQSNLWCPAPLNLQPPWFGVRSRSGSRAGAGKGRARGARKSDFFSSSGAGAAVGTPPLALQPLGLPGELWSVGALGAGRRWGELLHPGELAQTHTSAGDVCQHQQGDVGIFLLLLLSGRRPGTVRGPHLLLAPLVCGPCAAV